MENLDYKPANSGCIITGTDTDAGKTIATAGLLRAFHNMGIEAQAIKPIQTGCYLKNGILQAPDTDIYKEAINFKDNHNIFCQSIYRFKIASSPHLAIRQANMKITVEDIAEKILKKLADAPFTLIECAGGLMTPVNEAQTFFDLACAVNLPLILVVKNRLGCINQALLCMKILAGSLRKNKMLLLINSSPEKNIILAENSVFLQNKCCDYNFDYFYELPYCAELHTEKKETAWQSIGHNLENTAKKLIDFSANSRCYNKNITDTEINDGNFLWHPYAKTHPAPAVYEAARAYGNKIFLKNGCTLIDGMSSWWCANLGYGRADLQNALMKQAADLPHIMFGGFTHSPAVMLAKKLLEILPFQLSRVFFADSGSVSVEIALKMAIQYQLARGKNSKTKICAFRGAYHGDTAGAMSVCDPVNGMHHIFKNFLPEQLFLDRPCARFNEQPLKEELDKIENTIAKNAHELAALIIEPIVQGAGGMWFYNPQYLLHLRHLCNKYDILLIADEIATAFGRTGKLFALEWADIEPDILCIGKALTGGMLSFAAALAKEKIAEKISEPDDAAQPGILLHGPTFMANPLACSVALQAINTLLEYNWQENVLRIENHLNKVLEKCKSLEKVADVRVLGAIGVIETKEAVSTEKLQKYFAKKGVWIRPFNKLVYIMPPFITNNEDLDRLADAIYDACQNEI